MPIPSMLSTSILHIPHPPAVMDDLFIGAMQLQELSTRCVEDQMDFFTKADYPVYQGLWRIYREFRRASNGEDDKRLENLCWRFWGSERLQNNNRQAKFRFDDLVYRISSLSDPNENPPRTGYQVDIRWRTPRRTPRPHRPLSAIMPEYQPTGPIAIKPQPKFKDKPYAAIGGTVPAADDKVGYYFPSRLRLCDDREFESIESPPSSSSSSTERANTPLGSEENERSCDAEFHWFDPSLFELDEPADQATKSATSSHRCEPVAEETFVMVPRVRRRVRRMLRELYIAF